MNDVRDRFRGMDTTTMPGAASSRDMVRIVLADSNYSDRLLLVDALANSGIRGIKVVETLHQIETYVSKRLTDLVACDIDTGGGDAIDLVRQVRYGSIGRNPFTICLVLSSHPSEEIVKSASDAGADGVLRKPYSRERLVSTLLKIIHRRPKFVVSSDYIGPNRRLRSRETEVADDLIDAPNTLLEKVQGTFNFESTLRKIGIAAIRVNENKIRANIRRLNVLVQRLVTNRSCDLSEGAVRNGFAEIADLALETEQRIRKQGSLARVEDKRTLIACRGLQAAAEQMFSGAFEGASERSMGVIVETLALMDGWVDARITEPPLKGIASPIPST